MDKGVAICGKVTTTSGVCEMGGVKAEQFAIASDTSC
jgi:hypothetical protein